VLKIDGIDTYYGETQVLFGVSLEVGAGEIVALLGPSGAGKTTTLRSVLGLTPARTGRITFCDRDITRLPTHEIARAGVGWVPDDRRVFPTLTAARNLAIARKSTPFKGYDEDACCDIFPALRHLLPRECENMSGGELQMVSISRALVGAPGLVLFDEPSQGLAPKVVQDVMRTVVRLKATGVACLVVDQNVRTVLDIADRVYVLHGGRVVHVGTGAALRADAAARQNLGLAA
jgi:branched-chain amino acid transport system ATP-binding protein